MTKGAKEKDFIDRLKGFLRGKVVIIGIGNSMRGDDGAGLELAKRLRGKISAQILEGTARLESFINPIIDAMPNAVLILDSCDFKKSAGAIKILDRFDISKTDFLDHTPSTRAFIDNLVTKSHADIALLGIQPSHSKRHLEMSGEVQKSISKLEETIIKIFAHMR